MKTINILIFIGLCLFALSCNKDKPEPNKNKLVGTWVEKYPEKFGGISDTLIFTNDFYVARIRPCHLA